MVEITVTQGDGHIGFATKHSGIFLKEPLVRSGAVGSVESLREHLMELCDRLEANRKERIATLRAIRNNLLLPTTVREVAAAELERYLRAEEENDRANRLKLVDPR